MLLNESKLSSDIYWSEFNASLFEKQNEMKDTSVLLPLFKEQSKSAAMIKHGMDVIKLAVDKVNKDQTPVIVFDQPLYALAKKVQCNLKDIYRGNKICCYDGSFVH